MVQISRGAPVHSDDPKTPHDGKPAGRTYKITVAAVDPKNRTVGWKGNAGYNHWVHQDFITLVTKGASEDQTQVQNTPEPVPAE